MALRIAPTLFFVLTVFVSPCETLLRAEGDSPPAQPQYMPRENCRPKIQSREIPISRLTLPFSVTTVNGPWLWVGEAWVQSAEIVPVNQADAYYTGLLRQNPANIWALRMRAVTREAENRLDDALRDLSEIVRLKPADVDAYVDRAFVHGMKDNHAQALKDIEVALKLDPTDSLLYVIRAISVLLQTENDNALKRALQDCDEAIRLEPELGLAFLVRGEIRLRMKDYDKALLDFAESIKLEPAEALGHMEQAWLWATANDPKYRDPPRAVAAATKACELTHWKDPGALYTLGFAYKAVGDIKSANHWIIKATRLGAGPELPKGEMFLRSLRDGGLLQKR